jgi:hypothetical protein
VKRQKGSTKSNKVAKYLFCIWNCVKKSDEEIVKRRRKKRQINKSDMSLNCFASTNRAATFTIIFNVLITFGTRTTFATLTQSQNQFFICSLASSTHNNGLSAP